MKITCDNCGAKYSIADEKVQGKVFKIRCKKCSNIIVVRGTNDDEAYAAGGDAGGGAAEDDGWHVVIGREQTGPMSVSEVRERFAAGEINADSYVWREGFADWQRLAAVPAFSDLGAAPAAAGYGPRPGANGEPQPDLFAGTDSGGEETNRTDAGSLFGAEPATGGTAQDLFAAQDRDPAPGASGGGLFAAAAAPQEQPAVSGGGDLFGAVDSMPSDPSVPIGGAPHMTGQRGENSVLFSLANLQALAMGGKSTVADAGPVSTSAAAAPGMASGGGSGLIDIRAMAASSGASSGASRVDDDLPALGGFASPIAAAPVLLPTASSDRPKWVLPAVIGMGSLLVVALVVLVVVLAGGKKETPPTTIAAVTPGSKTAAGGQEPASPDKPVGAAASKKTDPTSEAGKGGETKAAGTAPATETKADEPAAGKGRHHRGKRRRGGRHGKRQARVSAPAPDQSSPKAAEPARKRKGSGKRDELDDLIDGALSGKKKKRAAAAPRRAAPSGGGDANLPERLERGQIVAGMRSISGRVKACYDRFKVPGMAMVRVTIAGSGKVSGVNVSGLFAGTPTGSCVASAVRSARFPRCKKPTTISYPFSLR